MDIETYGPVVDLSFEFTFYGSRHVKWMVSGPLVGLCLHL